MASFVHGFTFSRARVWSAFERTASVIAPWPGISERLLSQIRAEKPQPSSDVTPYTGQALFKEAGVLRDFVFYTVG